MPKCEVLPRVEKWVKKGSTVCTDGLRAYLGLKKMGYLHAYVKHNEGEWVAEQDVGETSISVHTQSVDGMWGHLKTWLRSRRGVHTAHLPGYVDCFEWRARTKKDNRFNVLLQGFQDHPGNQGDEMEDAV